MHICSITDDFPFIAPMKLSLVYKAAYGLDSFPGIEWWSLAPQDIHQSGEM